jgi:uncharacterized iron-regulated membrane protein
MCNGLRKAAPFTKPPSYKGRNFPEQFQVSFVYHPMKLLILGVIALVMLAFGGITCIADSDSSWRWSEEREHARQAREQARQQVMEAREQARQAREQARQQIMEAREQARHARDFAREQAQEVREEVRAQREAIREQRNRIREQMRDLRRDWPDTF